MKPALTPEEWAHREKWGAIAVGSASDPRPHALAALALHGQPFGFTREDVENLLDAAKESDEGDASGDYYLGGYQVTVGSEWLRNLAARIEALLPPEAK